MKGMAFTFAVFALLITGCGPAELEAVSHPQRPPEGRALAMDRVKMLEGNEILFSGRLLQYQYLTNARGAFSRYTILSNESLMATEGSIFAQLAKAGYTRRIRAEEPGRFVVNYVKNKSIPIVAAYSENVDVGQGMLPRSQVILTLQASD